MGALKDFLADIQKTISSPKNTNNPKNTPLGEGKGNNRVFSIFRLKNGNLKMPPWPHWPGPHCDGRPFCEWLPGINRTLPEDVKDLQGYGIPSTALPISVQGIASCGWRVVIDAGGKMGLTSGPMGAVLQSVCRRELEANADTIKNRQKRRQAETATAHLPKGMQAAPGVSPALFP